MMQPISELLLSPKYIDFFFNDSPVEFLEGTTFSGKTTTAMPKFLFKVAQSKKKLHIIAGKDSGTIEKNIINRDLGVLHIFGNTIRYRGNGSRDYKMPHLEYKTPNGTKIIFILGYDNKKRWEKALGGQYGCLFIDEINIANMDFVRESAMRCDYLLGTLNPDDESLDVYSEYINHARPLPKYAGDVPSEIWQELNTQEAKEGWTYWFFSFDDNLGLNDEKRKRIVDNVPVGTKLYKNKILGLRGRATGLVFGNFSRVKNAISKQQVLMLIKDCKLDFDLFSCGVDTAYSAKSPDTITFIFQGISSDGRLFILDEEVYNNKDIENPVAPSDVVRNLLAFLERNRKQWGFAQNVYIDNADQATLTELRKYKRNNPTCMYIFNDAWKKMEIIDRIHLQLGFIYFGNYIVLDHCVSHLRELSVYSWQDDKYLPEDKNDHTINGSQYGWIPYKHKIKGMEEIT